MAYRSVSGLRRVYYRQSGVWVLLATGTGKLHGMISQAWQQGAVLHWLQSANRATDSMTYQAFITTDKYAPVNPPTSVTITSIAGGGGTRQARINWVEASGNPFPSTSYDLYIYYFNNTDPSKNGSTMIAAGRLGTQFTFSNAGILGDADCYAQLSYQDPATGFSTANSETSHITL
jgi:hypothetical protein